MPRTPANDYPIGGTAMGGSIDSANGLFVITPKQVKPFGIFLLAVSVIVLVPVGYGQ